MSEPAEHAEVGAALERAAMVLPEDWEITVGVEKGAGWVELYDPDGNYIEFASNRETLSEQIGDAIDHAVTAAQNGEVTK